MKRSLGIIFFVGCALVIIPKAQKPAVEGISAIVAEPVTQLHEPLAAQSAPPTPRLHAKPTSIVNVREKIQVLSECYESGCVMGEGDAKGAYFEIGKRITTELDSLAHTVEADQLIDQDISDLARQQLTNEDGFVKEAALKLIATQPTSADNLSAILKDVVLESSDAELIDQALLELARYDRAGDQYETQIALRESLLHGSPFVAMKIAEGLGIILNSANVNFFARVAIEIEDGSAVKAAILHALEEFSG